MKVLFIHDSLCTFKDDYKSGESLVQRQGYYARIWSPGPDVSHPDGNGGQEDGHSGEGGHQGRHMGHPDVVHPDLEPEIHTNRDDVGHPTVRWMMVIQRRLTQESFKSQGVLYVG